jgi:protein SCO1/2
LQSVHLISRPRRLKHWLKASLPEQCVRFAAISGKALRPSAARDHQPLAKAMTEQSRRSKLKQVRILVWALVAVAIVALAVLLLLPRVPGHSHDQMAAPTQARFGGPFRLVGANGKPFDSAKLAGKPYAIYFGFTRCGDVCPTTLSRLVRLRQQVGREDAFRIVFVTIDPANDGPKEVGQYASLFNSPIIGLTGSQAQIDAVKKQYGIYAEPVPHAAMGEQMNHTSTVLLFDRHGQFVTTIAATEPDSDALAKIKSLVG